MARRPFVAGNWKMHTTVREAEELVDALRPALDGIEHIDKVVCPPFVSLTAVRQRLEGSSIMLGAQNMHFEESGAYTGEVSPTMLRDLCDFVIIGHSERRHYFQETDETIKKKLQAALKTGLKPILCIGETLEQRDAGRTQEVVVGQLTAALTDAGEGGIEDLTLAYEPVWAIGTGRAATGKDSNDTISCIRGQLRTLYGEEMAQQIRVLYGGSVKADNIEEFVVQPEIDGALVGGASLDAEQFSSIVRQTAELRGTS